MASPSERFFQLFNILTDSRYSCQVSNEWKNRLAYIAFEPLKKWSMNWYNFCKNCRLQAIFRDFLKQFLGILHPEMKLLEIFHPMFHLV